MVQLSLYIINNIMGYKIFDASFYKYTIFLEWDGKVYHFPSIIFSVAINTVKYLIWTVVQNLKAAYLDSSTKS
jgi:hypothetical protein